MDSMISGGDDGLSEYLVTRVDDVQLNRVIPDVDRIIADGKLTVAEQVQLNDALMADGTIDEAEQAQIQRVIELIEKGELQVDG